MLMRDEAICWRSGSAIPGAATQNHPGSLKQIAASALAILTAESSFAPPYNDAIFK